jgi:glucose-1-phosphate adenylyltransferase
VYQNLYSIARETPSHVIVLSGDHVYKMDYAKMLRFHVERNADATLACLEVPLAEASRFGIVSIDENDRVTGFQEKPVQPTPMPGSVDTALGSMGIYIFKADVLVQALEEDAGKPDSNHDFGKNIIPSLIRTAPCSATGSTTRTRRPRSTGATSARSMPTSKRAWTSAR